MVREREKDRYRRFSETWRAIGVARQWRVPREALQEALLQGLLEALGPRADEVVGRVYEEAGRGDGPRLAESLGLSPQGLEGLLSLLETSCLMSGVETEVVSREAGRAVLQVSGYPFRETVQGLPAPAGRLACERYVQGIVSSWSPRARVGFQESQKGDRIQVLLTLEIGE